MDMLTRILELVQSALDDFGSPNLRLSSVIRKAIRIAHLRNDYSNLWWLQQEMVSLSDDEALKRVREEMKAHYSLSEYIYMTTKIGEIYISSRKVREIDELGNIVDKGNFCSLSIPEIEERIGLFEREAEAAFPPSGLHPVDLYFVDKSLATFRTKSRALAQDYRDLLHRVGQRVYEFLSNTEKQLIYGQINSDIFERNRQYVDLKLKAIAPDTLEQFNSAYRRLSESDSEAGSQALLSCRRILKSLADSLYPPSQEPVVGQDGKKRVLTDDKYIARLWQFVADKVKGRAAGDLLLAQIDDLGTRIDRIYNLASKGVHNNVSEFEVNQCVIQTWLTIGDILRLADEQSAIYAEVPHNSSTFPKY